MVQTLEASELEFTPCNFCKTTNKWLIKKNYRNREGETTHTDVICSICRSPAVIYND